MVKLARLTGYASPPSPNPTSHHPLTPPQTPGSASVTFGNIKRKLKMLGEGLTADGPATPKNGHAGKAKSTGTPRSSTKRARKSSTDDDDATPSKKSKKNATKKNSTPDDDDDEELVAPRIKKEELADLNNGAVSYFDQLQKAAGQYDFEEGLGGDE